MFLYYLQLILYEVLSRFTVSKVSKCQHGTYKCCYFNSFSSSQVSQSLVLLGSSVHYLCQEDPREVPYQAPVERGPDFVSLDLHELFIAFFGECVENYFRFVFVLVFEGWQLCLSLSFVFKVRVVELVLALWSVHFNLIPLSLNLASDFRLEFVLTRVGHY
jgi:hypothetical protein